MGRDGVEVVSGACVVMGKDRKDVVLGIESVRWDGIEQGWEGMG